MVKMECVYAVVASSCGDVLEKKMENGGRLMAMVHHRLLRAYPISKGHGIRAGIENLDGFGSGSFDPRRVKNGRLDRVEYSWQLDHFDIILENCIRQHSILRSVSATPSSVLRSFDACSIVALASSFHG